MVTTFQHAVTTVRIAKKIFWNILTVAAIAMILKCILDDCKILDLELHVSCNDNVLKLDSVNTRIT
jgi:hypothetical protein